MCVHVCVCARARASKGSRVCEGERDHTRVKERVCVYVCVRTCAYVCIYVCASVFVRECVSAYEGVCV